MIFKCMNFLDPEISFVCGVCVVGVLVSFNILLC
jgi:hypothetical protein